MRGSSTYGPLLLKTVDLGGTLGIMSIIKSSSSATSIFPARFFLLIVIGLALGGCTTATEKLEKKLKVGEPVVEVYNAKYEEVETALKQAMLRYPQRVDNTEAGIFETDFVKGEARFKAPHKLNEEFSSGYRYRILVRLVRGNKEGRGAVKVVVLKQIELARDFFATTEPMPSDGLEERVILYRIGRELRITRALQKANQKASQKPAEG